MVTTTAAAGTSATASIASSLGVGTGVDTKALVASLVEAQFAAKNAQLTARATALTAQISGVAKLKSAITGFDSALKSLVKGGTLATSPTSSNTGVLTATKVAGSKVSSTLSARVTVEKLAQSQAATSNAAIDRTAGFKGGTLTVAIGAYETTDGVTTLNAAKTVPITIADGATLADIAAQITKDTGLQTQLVTDGTGVRLTIKGATGAAQAFEINGADTGTVAGQRSLTTLAVGPGASDTTVGTTAQDAALVLDGARFTRSTNSISDVIDGVKLELTSTSATPVTIGASPPGTALAATVADFVDTYNQLKAVLAEETNVQTGALKADTTATGIGRALAQLTTTKLAISTTGGPQTLADIGVSTNRDGTLTLDTAKLNKVLASDAAGVEALFADGTGSSGGGLSAAFSAITTRLTDKTYGLDGAATRYTRTQTDITTAQGKATEAATAASERMTRQYAAMDARVAAYKATQAFMTNQIASWNKSN